MATWKKGWKVIQKETRKSAMGSFDKPNDFSLDYPKNKTVKPKKNCGPLAVFAEKYDAKHFKHTHTSFLTGRFLEVVECKYTPSKENKMWVFDIVHPYRRTELSSMWFPKNTVLADAVVCLE